MELIRGNRMAHRKRAAQYLNVKPRTLLLWARQRKISECLALMWSDVDWLNGKLRVERGIVCQKVDDVKTSELRMQLVIAGELLTALPACFHVCPLLRARGLGVCFAGPTRPASVVL